MKLAVQENSLLIFFSQKGRNNKTTEMVWSVSHRNFNPGFSRRYFLSYRFTTTYKFNKTSLFSTLFNRNAKVEYKPQLYSSRVHLNIYNNLNAFLNIYWTKTRMCWLESNLQLNCQSLQWDRERVDYKTRRKGRGWMSNSYFLTQSVTLQRVERLSCTWWRSLLVYQDPDVWRVDNFIQRIKLAHS